MSGAWSVSDRVPDPVVASCLYDSADWLRAWETVRIERRTRHRYVHAGGAALPLYVVTHSPFWHGYERQAGVAGRLGGPLVFAGSTYSMYSRRGPVPAALVRGGYETAMAWVAAGEGELLVVPNLTDEGVADWIATAGPPAGAVQLDRTYGCELSGTFADHLSRLPRRIRSDVARRLRRAAERGLRVEFLDGPAADDAVPAALPLTVGTTDEHGWPPLYDAETLRAMLRVPGATLAVARVADRLAGVFFGFRQGAEVTFMCGGVDYASLGELSTYVALMYRCTEWAYASGMRRIEWGRDNYRFKERHGLTGTDLWALVYAPQPRPGLAATLAAMHESLSGYIEAA